MTRPTDILPSRFRRALLYVVERDTGETMLDTEIPFDLPDDAVADAVTPDTRPDRVVRAAFKTAELDRIRDLQDEALDRLAR